jgi:hypothetical protein
MKNIILITLAFCGIAGMAVSLAIGNKWLFCSNAMMAFVIFAHDLFHQERKRR